MSIFSNILFAPAINTQVTWHLLSRVSPGKILSNITQWILDNSIYVLLVVAIGVAIYSVLRLARRYAIRWSRKNGDNFSLGAIAMRTLSKTGRIFMIMVSARLVVGFSNMPFAIDQIVRFLFTITMAFQAAIWLREMILGLIERRAHDSEDSSSETLLNALSIIRFLVTIALFAIASIMVLDNLGVDVTGLVAGLGIGGIAIGLAAQGIFSDLFAALSIIFDKPFKRDEIIGYDNTVAKVEKIGLKSARLRSVNGEEVVISNANLLNKEIVNYSRLDRRRTRFSIGVIYQTAPAAAREISDLLKAIVDQHGGILIRCGFVGFGSSSIDFELDFDILSSDFEYVFKKRHDIGLSILEVFNEKGLDFAYPTQTTFTASPDGEMIMPYPKDGFHLGGSSS